jgi:hypothetical protein
VMAKEAGCVPLPGLASSGWLRLLFSQEGVVCGDVSDVARECRHLVVPHRYDEGHVYVELRVVALPALPQPSCDGTVPDRDGFSRDSHSGGVELAQHVEALPGDVPAGLCSYRLCRISGSAAFSVVTVCNVSRGVFRWRNRVNPARPYSCLLIIVVLVLTPSVRPLWNGSVSAAVTAWMSRSRPLVKECRQGRSASRALVIQCWSPASFFLGRGQHLGEGADQGGQGGHLRAGGLEAGAGLGLAAGEAVWPGEQDAGSVPG